MNHSQLSNQTQKAKNDPDVFGYSFNNCLNYKCIIDDSPISPGQINEGFNPNTLLCYDCKKDLKIIN